MENIKNLLNVVLEDDNTATGGVSFKGQTVKDFIEETGISEDTSVKKLNEVLVDCGIKPIPTTLEKTIAGLTAGTENTIKLDVLTWLEGSEAETLEDAINTLQNVQCENADVGHLVYSVDCGVYVYDHEKAILEILNSLVDMEVYDVDDINWEQHNQLSLMLNNWKSGDDRVHAFNEEHYDEVRESLEDDEDWESLDEYEQEDAINETLDVLFYQEDPFELTSTDKAELAWLAFEYHAQNLAEELEGIKEVIEGE